MYNGTTWSIMNFDHASGSSKVRLKQHPHHPFSMQMEMEMLQILKLHNLWHDVPGLQEIWHL